MHQLSGGRSISLHTGLMVTVLETKSGQFASAGRCHDSSIHTRPDHKIKSLDALDKQLMGCSKGAHVDLSDADRANVEQYLNEQFYKFK